MTELRPERPEDIDGIRAVHTAAFESPAEAKLVDRLRAGAAWVPSLSVVAVSPSGEVVAHALLSRIVLATADADLPALALGPVAVLPDFQNQGYGTAVIRDVLSRRDRQQPVVVLGDPAYYRRFGFEPGAAHGITGAWSSFGDAWQVLPAGVMKPSEVLHPAPWHDVEA